MGLSIGCLNVLEADFHKASDLIKRGNQRETTLPKTEAAVFGDMPSLLAYFIQKSVPESIPHSSGGE